MNYWQEIVEETGIKIGLFVAGCFGALVSFLKPKKLAPWERFLTVLAGGVTSMYLTPFAISAVAFFVKLGANATFCIAFLVGYSGLKSIEITIFELKKRLGKK